MRYARNPRVLWRSTSRGPLLLAPDRAGPELLGGVAAVVWEVLDTPATSTDVAGAADGALPGCGSIEPALRELQRLGLVQPAG